MNPDVKHKVRLWNRVSVRMGLGVLLLTWTALALGLLLFNSRQERQFTEQHIRMAKKEAMAIASDLAQYMLAGGGQAVWKEISAKASQRRELAGAANISVFNGAGAVKSSSDSAAVGARIALGDNPDCPRCESTEPDDFPAIATVIGPAGDSLLRIVNRVPASPACFRCHEATNPPRGLVSMDYDLAPLQREAAERRNDMLAMGLVAGILVMVLTALLFRWLVMNSVHAIAHTANRLAAGGLAARAEVRGKTELALLARDFNHMAERIEEQFVRIEAAHTESELLYTLVVEASKSLETGQVAAGVARVLLQKLHPRYAAYFLETAESGWTCVAGGTGRDTEVASGEGALEELFGIDAKQPWPHLADIAPQIIMDACRTRKLQLTRDAGVLSFALPVIADARLIGLLVCIGIAARIKVGEDLLDNLGAHLTLAAINSRNYTGAITDGLTRLKNKRHGLVRLDEAVYAAKRYKSGLGLLLCDIDHFKQVNDTYGHPAGDAVLREVSRRIAACARKADIAVRYGGEEFMLILPETEAQHLALVGEKVRQAVAVTPIDLGALGVSLPLSISVGVAAFHAHGDSAENLIARADAALYRAKEGGRDRVEFDQ